MSLPRFTRIWITGQLLIIGTSLAVAIIIGVGGLDFGAFFVGAGVCVVVLLAFGFYIRNVVRDAFREFRYSKWRKEARCLECGYDLRGQTEPRCPECGTPFGQHASRSRTEH